MLNIPKYCTVMQYEKPDFPGNCLAFNAENRDLNIPRIAPEFSDKTEAIVAIKTKK